ncbi:MAG: hypothetical protein HOV68_09210, partial [Streptomycetaceae bacterium]|nr:hypothetical protein [Streptomycetaceae bacterium]
MSSQGSASTDTVAAVSAAMRLPGVAKPPVRVGGRWFWIERPADRPGQVLVVQDDDGTRRVLLDPIRHNSAPGPSRGGWVVGPRGPDGEQYVVVDDYGEEASDAATAGLVIDVRTGEMVRRINPRVIGVGFRSPTEFVYEKLVVNKETGVQRIPLRVHDITTGDDRLFTTADVDYDDNYAHGFVRSPDGRWFVITETADIFGLGNRTSLQDLHTGHTYVHGEDRAAIVRPYFGTDGALLLEVDGEIQRMDLADTSPDAVRAALAAPEVLLPAEEDALV